VKEIQVQLKSKVRETVHKDLHTFMTKMVAIVSVVTTVTTDFLVIIVIKLTNVPIITFASIVKMSIDCYGYANMPGVLHSVDISYLVKLRAVFKVVLVLNCNVFSM